MQYLQGVALRRTCRIDGVRVTVHCARRRPSAAHRDDVDQSCPRDTPGSARAALGVRDRRHAVDASTGVPRPRPTGGGRSRAPSSKFHQWLRETEALRTTKDVADAEFRQSRGRKPRQLGLSTPGLPLTTRDLVKSQAAEVSAQKERERLEAARRKRMLEEMEMA